MPPIHSPPAADSLDLSVFDEASDGVLAFRDDGRYVYANPAARRLFASDDVVGSALADYAAEPSGELDEIWAALRGDGRLRGESLLRTLDDRLIRVRYRATATQTSGLFLSVVFAAGPHGQPRSGRENARAELFSSAFEHAPQALLLADDRRRYVYGNRMARSFLGVSKEGLVGQSIDDLAAPGTHERLEQLWSTFLAGGTMKGVLPVVLPNGLERNIAFGARAHVRPARHLISFQLARADWETSALELGAAGPVEPLTFREREILTLLARGSSAKSIAAAATLSVETVRAHVRNAMKKLGAHTRPHAIALAISLRQIDP